MMSRVARWISGQSVATPSSTTLTRYSRWRAPITVASTQISVIVPVTMSDVTPRARSAPSSDVPANPSYPRFRKTGSSGPGASAGTVSALGVPPRQEDEGRPKPRGAPGGAGRCSGWSRPMSTGAPGEYANSVNHHRQALGAEKIEEAADDRHDLEGRRNLHRLARVEEAALHVDHQQRGAPGLGGEHALE